MKNYTTKSCHPAKQTNLPLGRAKLIALEVAINLASNLGKLKFPPRTAHLRDHLQRAADNTVLRLSEASGRTLGNRYQHIEAAYAENQEVQSDLYLLAHRGLEISAAINDQAQRLGGLIFGLLRKEMCIRNNT